MDPERNRQAEAESVRNELPAEDQGGHTTKQNSERRHPKRTQHQHGRRTESTEKKTTILWSCYQDESGQTSKHCSVWSSAWVKEKRTSEEEMERQLEGRLGGNGTNYSGGMPTCCL